MAKLPFLSLSSTVNDLRSNVNSLNNRVGDLALLNTSSDSDLVEAINSLGVDSASITTLARNSVSVNDTGGDGSLTYNSATGVLTYTGPSAAEVRSHISGGTSITFSSGVISVTSLGVDSAQLADDAVTAAKLANVQTLVIYDSTGTAVKTLYAAGS